MEAILEDLNSGASKASVCRNFGLKRSTLYDALNRQSTLIACLEKEEHEM